MLDGNITPPVVQEIGRSSNIDSPNSMRMSDKTIEIITPSKFVTAAPTWRNYIKIADYQQPEIPHSSVLPKTRLERKLWNKAVIKAWETGIKQADQIFIDQINNMSRDIKGMVLFRILKAKNMISTPTMSTANLGTTGNGSKMRLGDQLARITSQSQLLINDQENWKAAVSINK